MKLRHTKSVSFAIEMVRASLPHTPTSLRLTGMWMEMNMETDGTSHRLVSLLFHIYGAPSQVHAVCNLESEGGEWVRGTCTINLTSEPSTKWSFKCHRKGNGLEITPTRQYDDIDVEWLRLRAVTILTDERFSEFELISPYAARVLRDGSGAIHGLSLDAAVAEFDKFASL